MNQLSDPGERNPAKAFGPRSWSQKDALRRVAAWFIVNNLIALISSLLINPHVQLPFSGILLVSMIITHTVSGTASLTSYIVWMFIGVKSIKKALQILIPTSVVAAALALGICYLLLEYLIVLFFKIKMSTAPALLIKGLLIPILLITALISTNVVMLEYLGTQLKAPRSFSIKSVEFVKTQSQRIPGFSFKSGSYHIILPYADILYIASKGMYSLINTVAGEQHMTRMLLKNIEEIMPSEIFMRIHKSFIVNLTRITRIQYFIGGYYLAYLNDEDDTNLPVGRKYAANLKKRIGIDPRK